MEEIYHEVVVPHMTVSHDTGQKKLLIELFAPNNGFPAEVRIREWTSGRLLNVIKADRLVNLPQE